MTKSFKEQYTLDQRITESSKIKSKYPDRVPVIIECSEELNSVIIKKKYLVPREISVSSLPHILRNKSTQIDSSKAIILFVNNKIPKPSSIIGEIYDEYILNNNDSEEKYDKFLYINATYESTFG